MQIRMTIPLSIDAFGFSVNRAAWPQQHAFKPRSIAVRRRM
jgi:hypothetical protein